MQVQLNYNEVATYINGQLKYKKITALSKAVGYIQGKCGVRPVVKVLAYAASICATRLQSSLAQREVQKCI